MATEVRTQTETVRTSAALNELLQGEQSAIETYLLALSSMRGDPDALQDLGECLGSHRDRARRLRAEILHRGGTPANRTGAWGNIASLVVRLASLGGARLTIAALEFGEDHGLKEYEDQLPRLAPPARTIVSAELYPQQIRTHSIVSSLRTVMAMPQARVG